MTVFHDPTVKLPIQHECTLLRLVKNIGKMALATVLAVMHCCHEDTGTALQLKLANCIPTI